MADATDSKPVGSNTVWVQVPYPAPIIETIKLHMLKTLDFSSSVFLFLLKNIPAIPQLHKTMIKI